MVYLKRYDKLYELAMPARAPAGRTMVSVSLDPALNARLEKARAAQFGRETSRRASRANVVRQVLDQNLPR